MSKLSHLKIKNIFCLSNIFLFSIVSLHVDPVRADVNGIPSNAQFPKAEYPYSQAPDGCSGWQSTREVRDNWGPVSFTGPCNTHDKCYYTLGSNWNTCNERFYSDLRTACERDLRIPIKNPFTGKRTGKHLPPDPARLSLCYSLATAYYGGVQTGVAFGVFKDAQNLQRDYERWVASIKNPSSSTASGSISNPRPSASIFHSAHFSSELIGTAVGDNGLILRTGDGGASWITQNQ
jgi:hypothetical protein